jgi:YfiH family protein
VGAPRSENERAKALRERAPDGKVRGVTPPAHPSEKNPPVRFWRPPLGFLPSTTWFGLSTREGGVSVGPYAALNLGLRVGDDTRAVEENRRRFRAAAGIRDHGPLIPHQVHGREIVRPEELPAEADGVLARPGDPWVGASAADCAPVAVVDEEGTWGVLLHSGWRGARDRIAGHAVRRLEASGVPPGRLRAVIGPCLHSCCFPVGPEVAREFDPAFLRPHPTGQGALDLPSVIAATLVDAGVPPEAIHAAAECTSCESDTFFSHRRDRGVTGRHWALLRLE